ncbi:MAG: hypothetical protein MUC36_02425 [Planctomycetes bacterium]|nr:hypothetical protein [Planctomycetota bacterium]
MDLDAGKVIEAALASRDEETVKPLNIGLDQWLPGWLQHPTSKWFSSAALGAPVLTSSTLQPYWPAALAVSAVHILTCDIAEKSRKKREVAQSGTELDRICQSIRKVLTVIHKTQLPGTQSRLSILLPRRVKEGEWELIPTFRSDGIPVAGSRKLRVIANKHDKCEGVSGLAFQRNVGLIERCASIGSPEYETQMCVGKPFIEAAAEQPATRRNPSYILAIPLTFSNHRYGVLSVDTDDALNLLPESHPDKTTKLDDLTPAPKSIHDDRRARIEAIANVAPRMVLHRLFDLCGVRP